MSMFVAFLLSVCLFVVVYLYYMLLFWLMSMFFVFVYQCICCFFGLRVCLLFVLFTSEYFLLFLFTSKFCYHRERESSCDGGVRERDVDLERTYRYHAVTLGVLTVVFITTTLVTIKEQNGNFFLVGLCFLHVLSPLFQHFVT